MVMLAPQCGPTEECGPAFTETSPSAEDHSLVACTAPESPPSLSGRVAAKPRGPSTDGMLRAPERVSSVNPTVSCGAHLRTPADDRPGGPCLRTRPAVAHPDIISSTAA